MDVGCKWTNDYQFDTALLLSVFLGMFGADRWVMRLFWIHDNISNPSGSISATPPSGCSSSPHSVSSSLGTWWASSWYSDDDSDDDNVRWTSSWLPRRAWDPQMEVTMSSATSEQVITIMQWWTDANQWPNSGHWMSLNIDRDSLKRHQPGIYKYLSPQNMCGGDVIF